MIGWRRRVWACLIAVILAACDSSPVPTRAPAEPTTRPSASPVESPRPSTTPIPSLPLSTPAASAPPTSIALPAGFDAIPWADLPAGDGNENSNTVSIGVLGKPATTTRASRIQPDIATDGGAVLLSIGRQTEIVDAVTGNTIAMFDHDALELPDVPKRDLSYVLFNRRFRTDVAHGYLYFLSANRDGVQLRRFALDGSAETLLARIAPDPGRRLFYADFVLTATGDVVATACPADSPDPTEIRCRIYEAASGDDGPLKPRFLPSEAARPCALIAAGPAWVIGTNLQFCRADGGFPTFMPYLALDRSTLATQVVTAPSDLQALGTADDEDGPRLVANLHPFPYRYGDPPIGVVLRLDDSHYPIDKVVPRDIDPESPAASGRREWSIVGRGPGWTLFREFGPAYFACAFGRDVADVSTCPSGPVVLDTVEGAFELPPGTWGGVVPPVGSLGL